MLEAAGKVAKDQAASDKTGAVQDCDVSVCLGCSDASSESETIKENNLLHQLDTSLPL